MSHQTGGIEFRKSGTDPVWHWCLNCPKWPVRNFEFRREPPQRSEMCPECQAYTESGRCKG